MPIRLEKDRIVEMPQDKSVQRTLERAMTYRQRKDYENRAWTSKDLETLQRYWYKLGPVLLAGELKRSIEGVERMAKKLGLRDMEALVEKQLGDLEKRWRKLKL